MSERSSSESRKIVSRCPKRVMNGPCGGMRSDGRCEVLDLKCAFHEKFPSELLLDEGFEVRPRINPRPYFTKLLSETYEKATWIAEIPPRPDLAGEADALKSLSADALSIPDNPLGRLHVDVVAFAIRLKKSAEKELVAHLTCRDANRLALKSRIMGLGLIGVEHVLALTGDYSAAGVFDLDSMRLLYITRLLSDYGLDEEGNRVAGGIALHAGAGLNPHLPLNVELSRALRKLKAGGEFFVSQVIFDEDHLRSLLRELRKNGVRVPVFAGFLLQDRDKILKFARSLAIEAGDIPGSLEKLAERYLEILKALRKEYEAVGAYISTFGKLEYLKIWSEFISGSL